MNSNPPLPSPDAVCGQCGCETVSGGICPACVITGMLDGDIFTAMVYPSPAAPPQRVGDYDLLEEIARGGMGVVWRARQRRLQREVALKFVLEGVLPGEVVARRFRQEAEVAAQLSHPHIIAVHEVGEADGRYFISMELASGGTLAQRMQKGRFTPRAAAELTVKLARAVQHAHDHGVLHRDLKPGNVLFDSAGEPRVSDFGLARLTKEQSELTLTGAVMGTPSYMAPEQARGEARNLTTATDIYGLGTILYELLAGHPAFAGEVPVEVLRRVLDEEPPKIPALDRDLDTICRKCLCKNPEDRYRSARLLADDLERWLRGEAIHARRVPAYERLFKWMRRHPLLTALWIALLAAAIVIASLIVTSRVEVARARGAAEASATESRHRRADQHTTSAILAIERGDSLRALPSLAAAIRIGTGDPLRDRINRIRFGTILRQSPVLEQTWFPDWVSDVQIIEDQNCAAVCEPLCIRLLRMSDGTEAVPPLLFKARIRHSAQHPALHRLLVETDAGETSVWDTRSGARLAKIRGKFVVSPFLFPDKNPLLAVCSGNTARQYSVSDLSHHGPVLVHPAEVVWAWLCQDRRRIITCAKDQKLRVWDAASGAAIGAPAPCKEDTRFLMERPEKHSAQLKSNGDQGVMLDTETGALLTENIPMGDIRAVAKVDGWTQFARATREGFVVADGQSGAITITAMHGTHGNDAAFSRDGSAIFTRSIDNSGRLWHLSGRPLSPFLWQGTDPLYLALDSKAEHILVSSRAPEVKLWRMRPHYGAAAGPDRTEAEMAGEWLRFQAIDQARQVRLFFQLESEKSRPALVCVPPNDTVLHVRARTSATTDLTPPLAHHARIADAVFSPDGTKIASFTTSQCVFLWDAATGAQIGPVIRHDRLIDSIAFSPDGSLLLVAGVLTVRVWETATGTAATPVMLHAGPVYRASWNADGTIISTVDKPGRLREWNLSPDNRSFDDLESVASLYSAHRVTTGGALAPLSREQSRAAWEAAGKNPSPPPAK